MKSNLVNEWVDDKIHPITGWRQWNGNTELKSTTYKRKSDFVDYDYILPNNLPDNY